MKTWLCIYEVLLESFVREQVHFSCLLPLSSIALSHVSLSIMSVLSIVILSFIRAYLASPSLATPSISMLLAFKYFLCHSIVFVFRELLSNLMAQLFELQRLYQASSNC